MASVAMPGSVSQWHLFSSILWSLPHKRLISRSFQETISSEHQYTLQDLSSIPHTARLLIHLCSQVDKGRRCMVHLEKRRQYRVWRFLS